MGEAALQWGMALDPQRRALLRRYGDGVFSPISNRGLAKMERQRPAIWNELVWQYTRRRQWGLDTALGEALSSTLFNAAMPRHPGDRKRMERPRRLGRHLYEGHGGLLFRETDDAVLEGLVKDLVRKGLYAESARRAVSIVRGLALAWAAAMGIEARVTAHPSRGGRRVGARRPRPVNSPREVACLLGSARADLVLFVALVVGGTLREQEALAARAGDLQSDGVLLVRDPKDGLLRRRVVLAGWAQEVFATLDPFRRLARGAPLFPHRLDPERTRLTFGPRLRGLSGPDGAFTSSSLHRLGQAVLRAAGMPRELVRGTWSLETAASRNPPWWEAYARLQHDWRILVHPPVRLAERPRLPRRSSATDPLDPDAGPVRAASVPLLPASVHPSAPAPSAPAARTSMQIAPGGLRSAARPPSLVGAGRRELPSQSARPSAPARKPTPQGRPRTGSAARAAEIDVDRLERRLRGLESAKATAGVERKQILDEVRRLNRAVRSDSGGSGVPFVAGAATGVGLTLLLQRPDLLQRLGLDRGKLEELVREMSGEQETAAELPGEISYPYYVEPDAG